MTLLLVWTSHLFPSYRDIDVCYLQFPLQPLHLAVRCCLQLPPHLLQSRAACCPARLHELTSSGQLHLELLNLQLTTLKQLETKEDRRHMIMVQPDIATMHRPSFTTTTNRKLSDLQATYAGCARGHRRACKMTASDDVSVLELDPQLEYRSSQVWMV